MPSLTKYLLDLEPQAVKHATTHPWLQQAASGQLSNSQLAAWLTQDRLYISGYIKLLGGLLIKAEADDVGPDDPKAKKSIRRLEVLGASISNITRERKFFEDIAKKNGLPLDGTAPRQSETAHRDLLGLLEPTTRGYIDYMVSLSVTGTFEENLVLLWAMEVLYYQAWSFVKANRYNESANTTDNQAAERALDELIPNWTSQGFKDFVDDIANLVDDLGEEWKKPGSDDLAKLEKVWRTVLWYEEHFWNGLSYVEASKEGQTDD